MISMLTDEELGYIYLMLIEERGRVREYVKKNGFENMSETTSTNIRRNRSIIHNLVRKLGKYIRGFDKELVETDSGYTLKKRKKVVLR